MKQKIIKTYTHLAHLKHFYNMCTWNNEMGYGFLNAKAALDLAK